MRRSVSDQMPTRTSTSMTEIALRMGALDLRGANCQTSSAVTMRSAQSAN